ncbi:uroporphyrinogen-III synthase [Rhizobium sp. WW_1]|jgi:uroporphyrinogen-III synthase|uniref:uroporphyrinogen-III synthase n=1 Tax=Rhizobium sp. WW_1 TaxID=1907375 RepID=UPI000646B194|nr:uroporphyrinogen-III synthase [Rhizobium sp. WW_1]RKD61770.1 uroporphyrinogen-III synthase [Rhizobium sp. WW_1]
MRVVVTRPQHSGERTMRRLAQMGHEPLLLPLAEPVHHVEEAGRALLATQGAIAITSAEAIRALAPLASDLEPHFARPLFAVGKATAKEAEDLGFSNIAVSEGGGTELAALISSRSPGLDTAPLLYLAGSPRAAGFEAGLAERRLPFLTVECYRMRDIVPDDDVLRRLFADVSADAVLFYSHETVRRFFSLPFVRHNPGIFAETRFLCLSEAVAAAVPEPLRSHVAIADMPNEDKLMARLIHE